MTKRTRSRPREDERDQLIADTAHALDVFYGLGPQIARDLAVHFITNTRDVESGKLEFAKDEVKGIGDAVLRKHLTPRPTMVAAFFLSMDHAAMLRCLHALLTLDAIGAHEQVRRLIESVAHRPHIYRTIKRKKRRIQLK